MPSCSPRAACTPGSTASSSCPSDRPWPTSTRRGLSDVRSRPPRLAFTTRAAFRGGHRQPAGTFAYDDDPERWHRPGRDVLSSLAACTAMDVISIALKKRQAVERYAIQRARSSATSTRRSSPDRRRPRGRRARSLPRRRSALHRAVGDEVLPGQRDALGRARPRSTTRYRIRAPGDQPVEEGEVLVTGPYRSADPIEP